jgi:hypothetical protein
MVGRAVSGAAGPQGGEGLPVSTGLEVAREIGEEAGQAGADELHTDKGDDRDERDQQAVLGHGLALFTVELAKLDAHQQVTKCVHEGYTSLRSGGGAVKNRLLARVKKPVERKPCAHFAKITTKG